MSVSHYYIPEGCICQGDGLFGMECTAPEHAELRYVRAEKQVASLTRQLARFQNPWTVQVQSKISGSWSEMCHDSPLTLADAEKRMADHQKESPGAVFRVIPWSSSSQSAYVRESNHFLTRQLEEARQERASYELEVKRLGGQIVSMAVSATTHSLIELERDSLRERMRRIYARCVSITGSDNTLSEMTRAMVCEIGELSK
jgi:hypothetical protein